MSDEPSSVELVREAGAEVPAHVRRALWLLPLPSVLFAVGAVLDVSLSPLHAGLPALTAALKGAGWGLYLKLAYRAAGGVAHASPAVPMVLMALAFLGLEYGGLGLLAPVLVWLLPIYDYSLMYAEPPDGAVGGTLDTLKAHAGPWLVTMLSVLIVLVMVGFVMALPMSLFSTYASRESAWLADLVGGVLVGPLVHLGVLFRGRLFLALHGDPEAPPEEEAAAHE